MSTTKETPVPAPIALFNLRGYKANVRQEVDGMYSVHTEEPLDDDHTNIGTTHHVTEENALEEFKRAVTDMLYRMP